MGELDDRPGQVIWVKAKIFEHDHFEFKVEKGGNALNRVAKEYVRAREVWGYSEEESLEHAAGAGGMYGHVGEGFAWDRELVKRRVEEGKFYVEKTKGHSIAFYAPNGNDAGELYYPHPNELVWKYEQDELMSEQAEKISQAEWYLQSMRLEARDFWMAYQQALKEVDAAEQLLIEARRTETDRPTTR